MFRQSKHLASDSEAAENAAASEAAAAAAAAAANTDTDTGPAGPAAGPADADIETGTLEHLSDLFLRTLYVCSVGSQIFFALSPIAAYLPQYLAMQESAGATSTNASTPSSPTNIASSGLNTTACAASSIDRGRTRSSGALSHMSRDGDGSSAPSSSVGMHHRRETRSRSPLGLRQGNGASPTGGSKEAYSFNGLQSPTIPADTLGRSMSRDGDGSNGGGGGGGVGGVGGMSPISILILLLSHLFRLVYFYGHHIWLPSNNRSRQVDVIEAEIETSKRGGDDNDNTLFGQEEEEDEVQYDLVVQSFVMIAVQLLLVRVTARSRMVRAKRMLSDHDHNDTLHSFCTRGPSWVGGQSLVSFRDHNKSFRKSAFVSLGLAYIRYSVARVLHLLHPRRLWQYKTLREHVELLVVFMLTTTLYCRIWLFPSYGADAINRIRNISVLLESCLALPQVVQNYARKDTSGLSVVMVAGWIMGDFMKLVYFLIQSPSGGGGTGSASEAAVAAAVAGAAVPGGASGSSSTPGGATMRIFAGGCIVALALDFWVLLQLVIWYPTQKMLSIRASVDETWSRFKPHNAVGRKRAVVREMVRLMLDGGDK